MKRRLTAEYDKNMVRIWEDWPPWYMIYHISYDTWRVYWPPAAAAEAVEDGRAAAADTAAEEGAKEEEDDKADDKPSPPDRAALASHPLHPLEKVIKDKQ